MNTRNEQQRKEKGGYIGLMHDYLIPSERKLTKQK